MLVSHTGILLGNNSDFTKCRTQKVKKGPCGRQDGISVLQDILSVMYNFITHPSIRHPSVYHSATAHKIT